MSSEIAIFTERSHYVLAVHRVYLYNAHALEEFRFLHGWSVSIVLNENLGGRDPDAEGIYGWERFCLEFSCLETDLVDSASHL